MLFARLGFVIVEISLSSTTDDIIILSFFSFFFFFPLLLRQVSKCSRCESYVQSESERRAIGGVFEEPKSRDRRHRKGRKSDRPQSDLERKGQTVVEGRAASHRDDVRRAVRPPPQDHDTDEPSQVRERKKEEKKKTFSFLAVSSLPLPPSLLARPSLSLFTRSLFSLSPSLSPLFSPLHTTSLSLCLHPSMHVCSHLPIHLLCRPIPLSVWLFSVFLSLLSFSPALSFSPLISASFVRIRVYFTKFFSLFESLFYFRFLFPFFFSRTTHNEESIEETFERLLEENGVFAIEEGEATVESEMVTDEKGLLTAAEKEGLRRKREEGEGGEVAGRLPFTPQTTTAKRKGRRESLIVSRTDLLIPMNATALETSANNSQNGTATERKKEHRDDSKLKKVVVRQPSLESSGETEPFGTGGGRRGRRLEGSCIHDGDELRKAREAYEQNQKIARENSEKGEKKGEGFKSGRGLTSSRVLPVESTSKGPPRPLHRAFSTVTSSRPGQLSAADNNAVGGAPNVNGPKRPLKHRVSRLWQTGI